MKKGLVKISLLSFLSTIPCIVNAQHVWWNDPGCGDIMEMLVYITTDAPTTYYETLGWNQGGQAGGYTGLQTTDNGPTIIFSLWDPTPPVRRKITAPYINPNGIFEPFGGEGTGYHYLNHVTGWSINHWYLQLVRSWQYNGDTYFGMWIYDFVTKQWTHHITMDFPVANASFCYGAVSFLENFGGTMPSALRHVDLTGGWKRLAGGQWIAFNSASVDGSLNEYGAEAINGHNSIFMQNGISTTNNFSNYNINFSNVTPPFKTTPSSTYVSLQNTSVNPSAQTVTYTWQIDPTQNPQFAYQINLVDKSTKTILQTISDINPETRSVTFNGVTTPQQHVLIIANITDLYDISHSNAGWSY